MTTIVRLMKSCAVATIMVVALCALVMPKSVGAAEVSCISQWGDMANEAKLLAEWFSSLRRPKAATCEAVLIRGNIVAGDGKKLARLLNENHPFIGRMMLVSSGGLVEEAIVMGRMARRYLLSTLAPMAYPSGPKGFMMGESTTNICKGADCHCASACFLIWAAGVHRLGLALGIHRPTIQSTSFADMPPDRASVLYRELLENIARYLNEMGVPRKYIDLMSNTASSDMYWLDASRDDDAIDVSPSTAEWLAVSCGAMTKQERETQMEIGVADWSAPLGVDRRDAFQLAICRAWSSSNLTGLLYPSAECRRLAL
jgi:hypothetical protein